MTKLCLVHSYAFNSLKRLLPEDTVEKVKGMSITADGLGAVFDAPSDLLDTFLAGMCCSQSRTSVN
jgi:ATP-dependent RNA helicase DDX21